jgi:integrase
MAKSSTLTRARKSPRRLSGATTAKPYPGFPLTPHPSGRWCKKIRGKLHYFGKLAEPEASLERFNREWPYLKDGRTPPAIDTGDGCTIHLLVNAFLNSKRAKLNSRERELSPRSFRDYFRTCEILIDHFGRDRRIDDLRAEDFRDLRTKLAKTREAVALGNEINRIRGVLKFAFDEELIDKPVRFGQSFDRPSKKTLRHARNAAGPKLFTAGELAHILKAAEPQLKGMILLGLNCGFGNSDCATLPQSALDLNAGWVEFPRPKTAIRRRIPLWRETVEAVRKAIDERPDPKDPGDSSLVFLTKSGKRWVRVQPKRGDDSGRFVTFDPLSQRFRKLLDGLGINGHRNFYALRHGTETWGGEAKDQVAVDAIMGHVDPSMAGQYREAISDERLLAVVEAIRARVFPTHKHQVQ